MKYLILILLILLPVTAFANVYTDSNGYVYTDSNGYAYDDGQSDGGSTTTGGGGGGWSSWSWSNWSWGPVTTSSVIIIYGDYLIANGNYYLLSSTQHYQVGH